MNELFRRLLNLPTQASTFAAEVDHLHFFVIGVTMLGAGLVFAAALFFIARYGRRPGNEGLTPKIQGNAMMETGLISFVLVLFVAIWAVGFRQYREIEEPPTGAMDVYVTAKQWVWKASYPSGQGSVGLLYVPVHRPVRILLTSRDVIHSFYVPAFRIKQDVIPGRYTTAWFEANQTGTFPIRCAEYCGTRHSEMLGDVVVLSEADFEKWLAAPDSPVASTMPGAPLSRASGEPPTFGAQQREGLVAHGLDAAANAGCFRCHTVDGSPGIGPTWTGLYGSQVRLSDGATVVADEAYLTESMMDPAVKIVAGFPSVMPSYQGLLEPGDTAAIVELIKTLHATDRQTEHPNPQPVDAGVGL